jgi:tetratricopeptide (TPR) repeat protein
MVMKRIVLIFVLVLIARPLLAFQSIVILPFANESEKQEVYWLGEGFAESLSEEMLLKDAYFIQRAQRKEAYEDLHLPYIGDLTRATMLKIGERLAADSVIFGSYNLQDQKLTVQMRVIKLATLKLSEAITVQGTMDHLYDVQSELRQKLIQYFAKDKLTPLDSTQPPKPVPLHAYEAYIKGQMETNDVERVKFFQRAIQAYAGYPQPIYRLGQTLMRLQKYREANEALSKGKFDEPLLSRVNFLIALNLYSLQSYEDAYAKWLELSRNDPTSEVYNNLGVVLMQKQDLQNSGWYFSKAVEMDSKNPDYHFNLAASYVQRSHDANAVLQYKDVVERRPNDYQSLYLLSKLLEKTAIAENKKDVASKPVLLSFEDSVPAEQRGKFPENYTSNLQLLRTAPEFLLPEEKQYLEAAQDKMLEQYGSYVRTYQASARKDLDDKQPDQALIEIRKGIGLRPFDWFLRYLSGSAKMLKKDQDGAISDLEFSLWCQDNIESHLMLADLYRESERYAEAKVQVQESLALDPGNKKAMEIWDHIWDKH